MRSSNSSRKTRDFPTEQNPTMGEPDFNHLMRQNQLVVAEAFSRENLPPVQKPTRSNDWTNNKPAHKVVDAVNRSIRKICMSLLRYNMDKSGSSYAKVRLLARNKEGEKFKHIVYLNYDFDEFIILLEVMNSVYDETFDQLYCLEGNWNY